MEKNGYNSKNIENLYREKAGDEYTTEDDLPSQTIDNILKSKVKNPKPNTVKKLGIALGLSEDVLKYGHDFYFDKSAFFLALRNKNNDLEYNELLEDFFTETGADPTTFFEGKKPKKDILKKISDYLNIDINLIYRKPLSAFEIFQLDNVKPYLRPSQSDVTITSEEMLELFNKLSNVTKCIAYNLIYDLAFLEDNYSINLINKDI
jgi:hypothetical protein